MLSTRGVNKTDISGTARKFFVRPGQAPPRINILQNLYIGLNSGFEGGDKNIKILLSTVVICYLISVQSLTCWILKTKYYF